MTVPNPVLARKLGLMPAAEATAPAEASPMRLMRRALGRTADKAVGLSASVLGISEEECEAEQLVEDGPDGWVVLGLRDGTQAGLTGVFLLDPALRSALIEMQTMGNLLPAPAEQRKVTRTDAALSVPFASQLLQELAEVGFGSGGVAPGSYDIGPIDDLRTAGLVMVQGGYRSWRITVQLGGAEAQGEMLIAMRPKAPPKPKAKRDTSGWSDALRLSVEEAPADLDAVLTKMKLPFDQIEAFEVGQLLPLSGTTVGSVRLIGPGDDDVATARLGQVAGKRAVRIERPSLEMEEAPPRRVAEAPAVPPNRADAAPDLIES